MAPSPRSGRARRALLTVFVTAAVALPVSGAARPAAVPAPAPAAVAPLDSAGSSALEARYAAGRAEIRAARDMAARHGDRRRATALTAMARPGRTFLMFDGRDGGRGVEVFGDLSRARRIAVLVPGAGVDLDHYGRLRRGAGALLDELGSGSAVVVWLGYRTPAMLSPAAMTPGRADEAAPALRSFVRELSAAKPSARVSLLCHSYGSVVCARAASGLEVADLVLYGSPGTGAGSAAALHTRATVRAGLGGDDWIARVPHVAVPLPYGTAGFGTDPVAPEFGAEVFDAGGAGHSGYLEPGSVSLRSIAGIVAGTAGGGHA
ncbi:alpha/beta hydrolase [Streptomyces sp. NPDC002426]